MWLILALVMLLSGCTNTVRVHYLKHDELGPAASCMWKNHEPYNCQADTTRGTIDLDYLEEILNLLEQYKDDEYNRRKL